MKRLLALNSFKMKWSSPGLLNLPSKVETCGVFPIHFSNEELGEQWVVEHRGPTIESNWLIPDHVLLSSHPHSRVEKAGMQRLFNIISEGLFTFVNLQTSNELSDWNEYPMSYVERLRGIQKRVCDEEIGNFDFKFINLEIEDREIPSCEGIRECVDELIDELENDRKILIHCKGGKGRTGVVAACLLSDLYPNCSLSDILKRIQAAHDSRVVVNHRYTPQEYKQYVFIRDYIGEERNDILNLEEQLIDHFGDISS